MVTDKKDEALKLALEVIEAWDRGANASDYWRDRFDAITAIREALAEQPAQQEPVGVVVTDIGGTHLMYGTQYVGTTPDKKTAIFFNDVPVGSPLYTSPQPSKPWVGLTEEDYVCISQLCEKKLEAAEYAEHLLREKNA